jgi:pyridinium-3,5-bisthiocarboxylic acid mononucleotide nickel chelatase
MKILYYDCFSGISGDMNLGAMIDLGIEEQYLLTELAKLRLQGWKLEVESDQRHGIKGTKVTVHQTRHEHAHRHLSDIEDIIDKSDLGEKDKLISKKIFLKVAEAEAKVHGISVEKVHFHEVGAVDSIIDIVGAAICYNALGVDEVHVSVVELGGGMVNCDHGKLPVPAPATAEIIKSITTRMGGVDFEATTPTGAAIIATLGKVFNSSQPIHINRTGYGVGHKDHPDVPNLLRVFLGETEDQVEKGHESLLIECNIDDMNPEFFDHISERLFNAGASDVFLTNIIMKKGRPGIILNVILEKEHIGSIKEILFTETTTLGIRTLTFTKDTLVRNFETLETSFGKVTVKKSFYRGHEVSFKPEYEECRKIALQLGKPIKEVYNSILLEIMNSEKRHKNVE